MPKLPYNWFKFLVRTSCGYERLLTTVCEHSLSLACSLSKTNLCTLTLTGGFMRLDPPWRQCPSSIFVLVPRKAPWIEHQTQSITRNSTPCSTFHVLVVPHSGWNTSRTHGEAWPSFSCPKSLRTCTREANPSTQRLRAITWVVSFLLVGWVGSANLVVNSTHIDMESMVRKEPWTRVYRLK